MGWVVGSGSEDAEAGQARAVCRRRDADGRLQGMTNDTAALAECGGVYTFGLGEHGRLGHEDEDDQLAPRRVPGTWSNDERVVMVVAGHGHTVALSEAGHGHA